METVDWNQRRLVEKEDHKQHQCEYRYQFLKAYFALWDSGRKEKEEKRETGEKKKK